MIRLLPIGNRRVFVETDSRNMPQNSELQFSGVSNFNGGKSDFEFHAYQHELYGIVYVYLRNKDAIRPLWVAKDFGARPILFVGNTFSSNHITLNNNPHCVTSDIIKLTSS